MDTTVDSTGEHIKLTDGDTLNPHAHRIMGKFSYFLVWFGGCFSIGTFTLGSSLAGELNLLQTVVAIAIACVFVGIGLTLNGIVGYKSGVPFVVQARGAFGEAGTRLPGIVRAVPAIVWYGFLSWIGASALNTVATTLFGFDNIVVCFIAFQFLQILLSVLGFEGVKWLENLGSFFILAALVYMFYNVIARYGTQLRQTLLIAKGSWGLPFWRATMLFLGVYCTMMLNVSDYTRELKKGSRSGSLVAIHSFSIMPATLFMGLIGLMVTSATGVSDPIRAFSTAMNSTPLLVSTLLFVAFAQIAANVLNNVIPPTYVLMDLFKINFKPATIIVGLLAFATFPWKLVQEDSAAGLQIFIQTYSAFLGPVFAVMIVDYYFLRRREIDVDALYSIRGHNIYRGTNWAGIIATAVGLVFAMISPEIAWYLSLIPAGLTYWLLMTHTGMKHKFPKKVSMEAGK